MSGYDLFPAVDGDYDFPPQVRQAIADSPEVSDSINMQLEPAITAEAARAEAAEAALALQVASFTALGVYRGVWSSLTDYAVDDVVSHPTSSGTLYSAVGNPGVGDVPGVDSDWVALPTTVDTIARDGGGGGQKKLALQKSALVAAATTQRNLFPNPGAEYSTIPGAISGSVGVTRTNVWAANGVYSYRLTFTSTATSSRWITKMVPVLANQPVRGAATVHNGSAASKEPRFTFRYYKSPFGVWKGQWGNLVDYVPNDVVVYLGIIYYASGDPSVGSLPSAGGAWTAMASTDTSSSVPFTFGVMAAGAVLRKGFVNPFAPAGATCVALTLERFTGGAGAANGDIIDYDDIVLEVGVSTPSTDLVDGNLSNGFFLDPASPETSDSYVVPPMMEFPTYGDGDLITTIGDSISAIWHNSTDVPVSLSGGWPEKLATLFGARLGAMGVSGDGPPGITARQGSVPTLVAPVTIAASGPTTLTILANPWKTNADGAGYLTDTTGTRVPGYKDYIITSGVEDPSGTVDPTGDWKFFPANPGTAITLVGPRVRFEPVGFNGTLPSGTTRQPPGRPFITTILMRNFYYLISLGDKGINQTLSRYRSAVDYALNQAKSVCVEVLEVPYAYNVASPGVNDEAPGSARRAFGEDMNAALQEEFRPYWNPWVTDWMLTTDAAVHAGITYTTQELDDIANGIIPFRFRRASTDDATDTIHLSDKGGTEACQGIYLGIQGKGRAV